MERSWREAGWLDHAPTTVIGYGNNRRAWNRVLTSGKVGIPSLSRKLYTDEHGFPVFAPSESGDFALIRTDQESIDLASLCVAE